MKNSHPIREAPRVLASYLLLIELGALAGMGVQLALADWSRTAAGRAALVFVLAVGFEEATRKAGTLRIKLSQRLKPDMTSVWACACAIALPPGYAAATISVLLGYIWLRLQRPAGEMLYRKLGTAATIVIGCLLAAEAVDALGPGFGNNATALTDAVAVLLALATYTAVNRLLVTGALLLLGARGRDLLGSRDDNLIEAATLCLGGLASLALLHEVWLLVLVLLPMSLLQRSAVVRQLEIAASTDDRTGLWTAVAWEHLSQRELSRAHREHRPVAVLMVDLDRFKSVNDTFGHLVGDVVLKAVGQRLRSELRGYDLIGRLGGEEFVALLPGVDELTALGIAERLRAGIAGLEIGEFPQLTSAPAEVTVTVSIGVACGPRDGTELAELLHVADAALYTAKRTGRNRVCRSDRPVAVPDSASA